MTRTTARIGVSAALLGGSLVLGAAAAPAGMAAVRPATATNCTYAGTNYGGVDPHYWGMKATCDDTPAGEWQLVLYCESYGGTDKTVYGGPVYGDGTSFAQCPGTNWEINGKDINNIQ
jgi:hypothetical protein